MGKCAKTNGMDSTLITRSCWIIAKGPKTTFCFWEMIAEEHDKHHLPHQFNKEFYEAIDFFQGEQIINASLHMKDL
jgi:hypothetical protein